MTHSFKTVGESDHRMYGPRSIVVCGFSAGERKIIYNAFLELKFKDLPVIFTGGGDRKTLMKEMVARPHKSGMAEACDLTPAIIMSGLTEKELHKTMAACKRRKLPPILWATLTPTSESWSVEALVKELKTERLHFDNPPGDN